MEHPDTRPAESPGTLLKRLLAQVGMPPAELPYTPEFEALFAAVSAHVPGTQDRHALWKLLLEVMGGASGPTLEEGAAPTVDSAPPPMGAAGGGPAAGLPPYPTSPSGQPSLFDVQPWTLSAPKEPSQKEQSEREKLLAALSRSDLATTELRVAHILQRYPETRDSDTAMAVRYWSTFQADVLEAWDKLDLTVLHELDPQGTLSRIRRHIQNDLALFTGSAYAREAREELQQEFGRYLAAHRPSGPEIRFYLDETGNEGNKTYTGVAGVCVMNWKQYEKHAAGLAQWRAAKGWPETIHFVDTGSALQPRAMALLDELRRRRGGLLFVGYALPSRGQTHPLLVSLFIQIVVDTLHHMRAAGCLDGPRSLTLVKEADAGFDAIHLPALERYLGEQVAREFPGLVSLRKVEAFPKGREVLLECADLLAGGMQRRAHYKGPNPKDVLAEAVFNVTGFEDPRDGGTVFKGYP
jgi:hypothetical protein